MEKSALPQRPALIFFGILNILVFSWFTSLSWWISLNFYTGSCWFNQFNLPFSACFDRPGRSVASLMAGAKGSILADTKIYFDEFQWWRAAPNHNQDIPGTCPLVWYNWNMLIKIQRFFSMFHHNGTMVVRRTAPVQEAQRRIGSVVSKHSSSTSSQQTTKL